MLYKEVARLLGVLSISCTSRSFKTKSSRTFEGTLARSDRIDKAYLFKGTYFLTIMTMSTLSATTTAIATTAAATTTATTTKGTGCSASSTEVSGIHYEVVFERSEFE